jgi:hypothetical protein
MRYRIYVNTNVKTNNPDMIEVYSKQEMEKQVRNVLGNIPTGIEGTIKVIPCGSGKTQRDIKIITIDKLRSVKVKIK